VGPARAHHRFLRDGARSDLSSVIGIQASRVMGPSQLSVVHPSNVGIVEAKEASRGGLDG
jgi:hypothetical protein